MWCYCGRSFGIHFLFVFQPWVGQHINPNPIIHWYPIRRAKLFSEWPYQRLWNSVDRGETSLRPFSTFCRGRNGRGMLNLDPSGPPGSQISHHALVWDPHGLLIHTDFQFFIWFQSLTTGCWFHMFTLCSNVEWDCQKLLTKNWVNCIVTASLWCHCRLRFMFYNRKYPRKGIISVWSVREH